MLMDYSVQSSIILYFKRCVCLCYLVHVCMMLWNLRISHCLLPCFSQRTDSCFHCCKCQTCLHTGFQGFSCLSTSHTASTVITDTCYCNRPLSVFWGFKLRSSHFCSSYSIHWAITPSLLLIVLSLLLSYHMAQKGVPRQFCTFFVLFRICSSYFKIIFQVLSIYKLI